MSSRFSRISISTAVIVFALTGAGTSKAASTNCDFASDFEKLQASKQIADTNYLEGVRAELAVRKGILQKVIGCGISDIETLKAKVQEVPSTDDAVAALKKGYVEQLDLAIEHYRTEGSRIETLGIAGSQELAKSLKEWRIRNYTPIAEESLHLILWARNQEFFKTARFRFSEIGKTIRSLKLAETEGIAELLRDAEKNLIEAERLNADARILLQEFASSDKTFDAIKRSLETLAKTYQNFFDLSQKVQEIIPR